MPAIDFHYVDELIELRERQHGGGRGAPRVINGYREGESLNRSCVVMLSALLQGYVEEVFIDISKRKLGGLQTSDELDAYKKTFRRWGNPSANNIVSLFRRIAIPDVLDGLSWPKCQNKTLREKLNTLNQIRNCIAHGRQYIVVDQDPYNLSLARVRNFRDFVEAFQGRFHDHVRRLVGN